MANTKSRLAALERKVAPTAQAPYERVIQPQGMTASERQEWRAALASQSGRFVVRVIVPWPPVTVGDVAELVEMGQTPDDLLMRMQANGSNSGVAAVRAYQHRHGLA